MGPCPVSMTSAPVYVMVDPKPLYATAPIAMLPSSIIFTMLAGIVFGGIGWGFLLLVERSRAEFSRVRSLALRLARCGSVRSGTTWHDDGSNRRDGSSRAHRLLR